MSQALRKLTGTISSTNTTMIFINQLREKIGVMFGSPETTTGGKALKFYASVRLDVRRIETLKDGTDPVGNRTRVKVVKNKVAPPFKQAEFDIIYGFGISREGGLIDMGVEQGFVRKAGAWYTYDGDQLGQGKENARSFLKDNPDLADELEKRIKEKLGIGPQVNKTPEPVAPAPVKAVPAKRASSVKTVSIKGASAKSAPARRGPIKDLSGTGATDGGAPLSAAPSTGAPSTGAQGGGAPASSAPGSGAPGSDASVKAVPVDF
jgi:hypothetical protein